MKRNDDTFKVLSMFEIKRKGVANFPDNIKYCFLHPKARIDGVAILETNRKDRPDSRFKHVGEQIAYGFCVDCYEAVQKNPQKQALLVEEKLDRILNKGLRE